MESEFYLGEKILTQNKLTYTWLPGVIINKTKFSRTYVVKDEKCRLLRRNTSFLKKVRDYDIFVEFKEDGNKIDQGTEENKRNNNKINRIHNNKNISRFDRIIKKIKIYDFDS